MSDLASQLNSIRNSIPDHVKLIAVSKTKPPELILKAYNLGQKVFGENKPQEMVSKYQVLPKDIEWHLIGHLQTNKVKSIAPFVAMIHSVDSERLLRTINLEASKVNRVIPCLLQFHIAQEESKFGFNFEDVVNLIESADFQDFKNIQIQGVMGLATFTDDKNQISREFKTLNSIFLSLKQKYFAKQLEFKEISMGMSDDYPIAISEGSTMVRIGSLIFGQR
jgi:PLP dependent protein